ncbi:mandelate racemase/muconate lactonizing enzyme family protein [Lutispora sp.]|uniref:mandelate racemase/muconate lactonizing enzyme family protein n=1 Tax=Lutispora sp. TaxID=2828727 RepID=UPI002B1FDFEF|nr:enolase C-terminal domain-like protein [Lutispora sp.]MEA4963309.1 enolase C-terminal domain-like protein [Lutispora sp.]
MNKSIIKDVQVKAIELPLKKQWKISLYAQSTRTHAVLRIITEDGIVGYGEAAPSPAFMGETGYTIELVVDKYLKSVLIGQNIFDVDTIHEKMNFAIYGNYAAKSTIDIALYDAMGKALDMPVYKLLGGKYREKAELSWVIGMQDLDSSIEEAREKLSEGYKVLKIKVGNSPETDYKLIEKIRRELGGNVALRLDANQGYDYKTALLTFREIEKFGLESIEQPVRRWDIEGMRMLRQKLQTPIMADESVSDYHSVNNIIREKACDIVNVKVGKVGGLTIAKKIAQCLEAAGLTATAGSNLEVGIGSAASIHFVASTNIVSVPNDLLLGGPLHQYDIIRNKFQIIDGCVLVPEEPGLGIEVDDDIFK